MLRYAAICSLDLHIEDADGKFDWARPSEELHKFVNDRERPVGTYLYGRRMYETMAFWETMDDPDPIMREYADIWQAAEKVVFTRTLDEPSTARTRFEREFDPEAVQAIEGAVTIGGPELATHAFAAGLVDLVDLFLCPVIVGGGKQALPDHVRLDLKLLSSRTFENGTVFLEYAR